MTQFSYHLSTPKPLDQVQRKCVTITFDVGRYGINTHTMVFETKVTEVEAVRAVERWLSQPMTVEHLERLIEDNDLFDSDATLQDYPIRGDALGDCIYLESVICDEGHITLLCGS
jgi:hypothetical protein